MTQVMSGELTYSTAEEVDTLLSAVFQFFLMQMEFVSRIINLVPETIQTIEDALRVIEESIIDNTMGIIREYFNNLKEAFLNVDWYYHLGFFL